MENGLCLKSRKYGFFCFYPRLHCYGKKYRWCLFGSPTGTLSCATFVIFGPGNDSRAKKEALVKTLTRKKFLGHNWDLESPLLNKINDFIFNYRGISISELSGEIWHEDSIWESEEFRC